MEQFILTAALEGLEAQKKQIEDQIGVVAEMVQGSIKPVKFSQLTPAERRKVLPVVEVKRKISAEGRAKIIAGQKNRWAAFHKAQKKGK